MDKYKPLYMGKVIPVDNPGKLKDFVANKYDSFSKIYDVCKDNSEQINDIRAIETEGVDETTISIKVSTDIETIEIIKKAIGTDTSISINNDVITANV